MKKVYSNAEIRAAERTLIGAGTSSQQLMELAGRQLADFILKECKRLHIDEVLFVCGGGNNGGDGFCAAEIVREKIMTQVLCLSEKFSPDCARMRSRYQGEILGRMPKRRYPLIVECLLGTGVRGTPSGTTRDLIDFIRSSGAYVISCDLPAGIGEGGAGEWYVRADKTLTIGENKQALCLADGVDAAGGVTLAKIGVSPEGGAEVWEDEDVAALFPPRKSHVNKGNFGRAAILANICTYPNAPLLSAQACLRSGVGYAQLFAKEPLYSAAIGKSAVMLQKFCALDEVMKCGAIALGMGAGGGEELYEQIRELIKTYEGVLILDADALNVCAKYGYEFFKQKKCDVILTPHIGEFARLTLKEPREILPDALSLAKAFAAEYKVTLILKNNRSVITDGQRVAINPTGSAALARGGSGDILSGFLVGTCARGVAPFEAACVSSYVLGRAGEIVSKEKGDYCATAEDVISSLPAAVFSMRKSPKCGSRPKAGPN